MMLMFCCWAVQSCRLPLNQVILEYPFWTQQKYILMLYTRKHYTKRECKKTAPIIWQQIYIFQYNRLTKTLLKQIFLRKSAILQISFYLNAVKLRTKTVPHIPMYSFGITLIALLFGGFRPFCTIFCIPFGDYSIFLTFQLFYE